MTFATRTWSILQGFLTMLNQKANVKIFPAQSAEYLHPFLPHSVNVNQILMSSVTKHCHWCALQSSYFSFEAIDRDVGCSKSGRQTIAVPQTETCHRETAIAKCVMRSRHNQRQTIWRSQLTQTSRLGDQHTVVGIRGIQIGLRPVSNGAAPFLICLSRCAKDFCRHAQMPVLTNDVRN